MRIALIMFGQQEEIEHLLANEQYIDGAKVEFVEVWQSRKTFPSRMLPSIKLYHI